MTVKDWMDTNLPGWYCSTPRVLEVASKPIQSFIPKARGAVAIYNTAGAVVRCTPTKDGYRASI